MVSERLTCTSELCDLKPVPEFSETPSSQGGNPLGAAVGGCHLHDRWWIFSTEPGGLPTTVLSCGLKLALSYSLLSFRKSDYISPLDDLAFDMYQDPEVAQIIRKLDERKREAVQKERYDYAKKLKQAIADLQKVWLLEKTVFLSCL